MEHASHTALAGHVVTPAPAGRDGAPYPGARTRPAMRRSRATTANSSPGTDR